MQEIDKRVALVTGGTSGIGLATAEALLLDGADLVVAARNASTAVENLIDAAKAAGRRVVFKPADMRDPEASRLLAETVKSEFGRLDHLVHAAGGRQDGSVVSMPESDWRDAFEVHLHSTFHLFRALHPLLAASQGSVVLVSSAAAIRGCPNSAAYQVVKAGVMQLTRALARDHAHEGIRVNCVAPGIIRTPFHQAMTEEARLNNIANRIPLMREGTPADVARMILPLLENPFMTGETVVIDGGMSMRMA